MTSWGKYYGPMHCWRSRGTRKARISFQDNKSAILLAENGRDMSAKN